MQHGLDRARLLAGCRQGRERCCGGAHGAQAVAPRLLPGRGRAAAAGGPQLLRHARGAQTLLWRPQT